MGEFRITESIFNWQDLRVVSMKPAEPRGLVIWYHGWSSVQDEQFLRAAAFALAGWETIIPAQIYHDNRGILDYEAQDSYTCFWETILQNIEEAPIWLAYAEEQGYERVIASGHSMGGFTALGVTANIPGFSGAISLNGSGNWPLSHIFMQARFGTELNMDVQLERAIIAASPHQYVRNLPNVPLLLLHGDIDPTVDPRGGGSFADTAQAFGCDVYYERIPDLGHYVTTGMIDIALEWLDSKFPQ